MKDSPSQVMERGAGATDALGRTFPSAPIRTPVATPDVRYRPEIDGLRAVAVVLVLLYHAEVKIAGTAVFAGGFIGVDIFLVISGYLISSILLREIANGRFSVVNFYERRARRILPALYLVLFATLPMAWLLMLPETAKFYGASLLSAAASVSNIFFWHEISYDAASELINPLLHTWSLGLEEQFYILFPGLLILLHRYARSRIQQWLAAITLLSFLAAEATNAWAPGAAFFLLPARAWELGIGALLAYAELHHGRPAPHRWLPLLGLGLVCVGVPLLTLQNHHPGLATLLPTLGTAAVIRFGGTQDPAGRFLASQPMVAVGLLSYSLYLWHQPVFAFGRLNLVDEPTAMTKFAWICIATLLAALTFFLVERPMRNRSLVSPRAVWTLSTTGAVLLVLTGASLYHTQGAPWRFNGSTSPIAKAHHLAEADVLQGGKNCLNYIPATGACRFKGGASSGYSLLLLGDSHGRTLTGAAIARATSSPSIRSLSLLNRGGCPFILGLNRIDSGAISCPESYNKARLRYALSQPRPLAVVMMRLPPMVEQEAYDNGQGGIEQSTPAYLSKIDDPSNRKADDEVIASHLAASLRALLDRGAKVVLVYPVPEMGWNIPYKLLSLLREGPPGGLSAVQASVSRASFRARTRRTAALLDTIGTDPNLIRVYPEHVLCRNDRCISHDGTRVFYRDDNHLSQEGGDMVMAAIMSAIEQRWGRGSGSTTR